MLAGIAYKAAQQRRRQLFFSSLIKDSSPKPGFTLAELLIALAILGVMATFTIPKVLNSQQNTQQKTIAKEAASIITGAYEAYRLEKTPTGATKGSDLTPYINYVRIDSTSLIDDAPNDGTGSFSCGDATWATCIKLHNGAILLFDHSVGFGGTSDLHVNWVLLDPDGELTNRHDSLWVGLYYNGRFMTWGHVLPNTIDGGGNVYPAGNPSDDPSWFNWN